LNGLPLNANISMYARTNRCYNERGSRTNYVRSSIPPPYTLPFYATTPFADIHALPLLHILPTVCQTCVTYFFMQLYKSRITFLPFITHNGAPQYPHALLAADISLPATSPFTFRSTSANTTYYVHLTKPAEHLISFFTYFI